MKFALLALLLVACRNDAISFAKLVAPHAKCSAVHTSALGARDDTAVCRVGRDIWLCSAGPGEPKCKDIGDAPPPEAP